LGLIFTLRRLDGSEEVVDRLLLHLALVYLSLGVAAREHHNRGELGNTHQLHRGGLLIPNLRERNGVEEVDSKTLPQRAGGALVREQDRLGGFVLAAQELGELGSAQLGDVVGNPLSHGVRERFGCASAVVVCAHTPASISFRLSSVA